LKLIVGCGYLGLRVARRWLAAGHAVTGVVHSTASAESLAMMNVRSIIADVTQPETLRDLPAAETLLYCVGYGSDSSLSRWAVYVDGFRAVLDAVSPEVRRVIFISTTGVYAEHDGSWVDEDSPRGPLRESGRALLAGEEVLAAHRLVDRGIVLRLAGIYGPGRLPRQAELVSGEPPVIPSGQFINLIHVEDAAAAVLAAEARAQPPRTYNVADGHPANRRELAETALQLGLALPSFHYPQSAVAARRRGGYKRVSNRRMLEELALKLEYPSYREGLKSLARA
jgi:nucleoside-diphosphate-sugar epimerase